MSALSLTESHVYANRRREFYVPYSSGHDDLLMSLALAVRAGQGTRERWARGRDR